MSEGSHPFPSRTRKLSPPEPMVLRGKPRGRVGRCRILFENPRCPRGNGGFLFLRLARRTSRPGRRGGPTELYGTRSTPLPTVPRRSNCRWASAASARSSTRPRPRPTAAGPRPIPSPVLLAPCAAGLAGAPCEAIRCSPSKRSCSPPAPSSASAESPDPPADDGA